MKICATNLSYQNLKFKNSIDRIKLAGYYNIELAPFLVSKNPFKNNNIENLKRLIDDKKIIIEAFQSVFHNINQSNDIINVYENTIERFEKIACLAKKLSVKKISVGNCPSRKLVLERNKLIDFNLEIFEKFSNICSRYNIEISLEPVNKKYFNNFLFSNYEVISFLKKLNKNNVKLLLDTGNLRDNLKNIKKCFIENNRIINHIHLSNSNIYTFSYIKSKNIINFLKKQKYNKSITLEFFSDYGNFLAPQKKILSEFIF